jgi:hypothetical protein
MKFLYADSLDYVDPEYDFLEDRSRPGREPYWDDEFSHQYLDEVPYDGILVSRGIVGDHKFPGKYTQSQAMRFRRDGARKFHRLDKPEHEDLLIYGDCGAFSYSDQDKPPYTPSEILEFYEDAGFSHGCSVDHVVFEFDHKIKGMDSLPDPVAGLQARERFDITLEYANAFYKECAHISNTFTPLGVVQGWSPGSMAEAARRLVGMGYDYLAVGGMVPLKADNIHRALMAIRELIPDYVKLHILGFGKIDQVDEFLGYNIASIDTTSPMLRAFKDNKRNFFMPSDEKTLNYYTSVRIPHATESRMLGVLVKKGHFTLEFLIRQETEALKAMRDLDKGTVTWEAAFEAVMNYTRSILVDPKSGRPATEKKLDALEFEYRRILKDRPWKQCPCAVCRKVSVEGAIFRASNRNKRRGMHNIWVFNKQLRKMIGREISHGKNDKVHSRSGTAE